MAQKSVKPRPHRVSFERFWRFVQNLHKHRTDDDDRRSTRPRTDCSGNRSSHFSAQPNIVWHLNFVRCDLKVVQIQKSQKRRTRMRR